jgi:hypothetical protein
MIALPLNIFSRKGSTPNQPIVLHEMPRFREIVRPAGNDEACCPVSLMPISSYAAKDIHTTLDGISYYRPSLKLWLTNHDTMPHNNLLVTPEELKRLWPQKGYRHLLTVPKRTDTVLGALSPAFLVAGGVELWKSVPSLRGDYESELVRLWDQAVTNCRAISALNCTDTMHAKLYEEWNNTITAHRAPGAALFAVGVGCVLGSLLAFNHLHTRLAGDQSSRPMTPEERALALA